MLSCAVSAVDQLAWEKPEVREDGSKIEAVEKYILYHWYEGVLQPIIEIDSDSLTYSDPDRRIGAHVYEIATSEAGRVGRKSDPVSYCMQPESTAIKLLLTLEHIQ